MAPARGPKGAGASCLKPALLVWFLVLVVVVIYANVAYDPQASPMHPADGAVAVHQAPALRQQQQQPPVGAEAAARPAAAAQPPPPPPPPPPAAQPPGPASGGKVRSVSEERPTVIPNADFENNAPWPGLRPGDVEFPMREARPVLPGADAEHMHGLLGRLPNGELRFAPTPLPRGGLTRDEKTLAHRGQCYNARASDATSVDRKQPDKRSPKCKELHNEQVKTPLPSASVVMVFHNEVLSALLRSIQSVLNHSPPHLLDEIIIIDDCSEVDKDRFSEEQLRHLQQGLEDYISRLPKVRMARMGQRRGLMLARMEGVWRAGSEVAIFLDSHIEATPGWIEPLLARVRDNPRNVVVPSIDSIDFDGMQFQGNSGLGVLGFSWTLGQKPQWAANTEKPQSSPIMPGGLFAAHRKFFLYQGGYDPGMRYYGGEEMEIGFRTWQCGGVIEYISCSHVFHIFRNSAYWHGTNSGGVAYKVPGADITRNKLRAAAVWMDDWSKLVEYASPPLPQGWDLGDIESRRQLRQKLQCKSFEWYLENVAKGMFYPETKGLMAGSLANPKLNGCLDTLGGHEMGLYPCHGQHGTQGLVMDGDGLVRLPILMYESCLTAGGGAGKPLRLSKCPGKGAPDDFRWSLDHSSGLFKSRSGMCLEALNEQTQKSPYALKLAACQPGSASQKWTWNGW